MPIDPFIWGPDFWKVPPKADGRQLRAERMKDFDPERATLSEKSQRANGPMKARTRPLQPDWPDGMMVAITTTLNSSFGSQLVIPGTGILMNNEMDDFSAQPGVPNQFGLLGAEANAIQPMKRMLSSMTPTLVTRDGAPFLITGSPGGSTIITTVLQVIMNVIDHGMSVAEAVGSPRFHHQWFPDAIQFGPRALSRHPRSSAERGTAPSRSALRHSILIKDGAYWGVKDPREFGSALGYDR